jgi:hypothetical protein
MITGKGIIVNLLLMESLLICEVAWLLTGEIVSSLGPFTGEIVSSSLEKLLFEHLLRSSSMCHPSSLIWIPIPPLLAVSNDSIERNPK